ncbi:MAG: type I-E CRISPR-associated protein Cas7/Cse4/CasC [Gammaproteobacteria bacterium]|nr:type I-E CRISPR-associated protein Cas7/Cse4/CasC [Gammaproteobacteria bacterium]MYD75802.1 type I-E CRISPR-associated protein Cas7/Cse4/CasC [Gammaproteobacteria bacterium]MYJ52034.1 type I-E CRISPR-associated protein Cas7/Cse4/CasC [Gammaproteobacteria bacterium]
MNEQRFLQIHFLTPYSSVLLNRDDSGLAKRIPYGGYLRTRISSQCLKRHWRIAEDPHALKMIDGADAAWRSREIVDRKVLGDFRETADASVLDELEKVFNEVVYGDKGADKKSRQTLLLGNVEIEWLKKEAERLLAEAGDDSKAMQNLAKNWGKEGRENFKTMRREATLPGGLVGALFGRMVTSDPEANITSPVHVAHAFTVHAEETESDYFVAVDDLALPDETGADTIQETELVAGLFYGYVVVDILGLLSNLGEDSKMASEVLHNLVYLIAEVSPGAKLGSTAPYSRASMMLLEAGGRQPRSLAEAFRSPCPPEAGKAVKVLADHLVSLDEAYETNEIRMVMNLTNAPVPHASAGTLRELAEWAGRLPGQLE